MDDRKKGRINRPCRNNLKRACPLPHGSIVFCHTDISDTTDVLYCPAEIEEMKESLQ